MQEGGFEVDGLPESAQHHLPSPRAAQWRAVCAQWREDGRTDRPHRSVPTTVVGGAEVRGDGWVEVTTRSLGNRLRRSIVTADPVEKDGVPGNVHQSRHV